MAFSDCAIDGIAGKYIIMPSCAKKTAMQDIVVNKDMRECGISVTRNEVGWLLRRL